MLNQIYFFFLPAQQIDCCTLGDVLVFFTGADYPPPMGFQKKTELKFLDNEKEKILPIASTCALTLWLPIIHNNYNDFKTALCRGILENDGFGGGP